MRSHAFLILFLLSFSVAAQNFKSWKYKDRYFSVSAGTGTASYFGELNFNNSLNDRISLFNVGFEARLLRKLGARLDVAYFTLKGADSNAPDSSFQRQRNLSFKSNNFQVQLHAVYYFRSYRGDYYKRWFFDPYLFSGIGFLYFRPTAELGGETFSLRPALTEGVNYSRWTTTLPVGLGMKFKVNEFTNINFELAYNFAFTDYLDDVSNTYATEFPNTTAELLSDRKDEVGVINPFYYDQIGPGAQRGDPTNNDSYLFINLRLELFIPPELFSKKEPVIRKPSY